MYFTIVFIILLNRFVDEAKHYLKYKEANVKVCCVIGFPLGATTTNLKLKEAQEAISHGADELDMVINVSALKNGELQYIENEIQTVAKYCHEHKVILKVIVETCCLTKAEIKKAVRCAGEAGADYVKTSTGFLRGGAEKNDVKLMKNEAKRYNMKVKASGGIRSLDDANIMLDAGAYLFF